MTFTECHDIPGAVARIAIIGSRVPRALENRPSPDTQLEICTRDEKEKVKKYSERKPITPRDVTFAMIFLLLPSRRDYALSSPALSLALSVTF